MKKKNHNSFKQQTLDIQSFHEINVHCIQKVNIHNPKRNFNIQNHQKIFDTHNPEASETSKKSINTLTNHKLQNLNNNCCDAIHQECASKFKDNIEYYYEVLVCGPFDNSYTYKSNLKIEIGQIVLVPLQSRKVFGVVIALSSMPIKSFKIKQIVDIYEYIFKPAILDFLNWVANYTLNCRGWILKMIIMQDVLKAKKSVLVNAKARFIQSNNCQHNQTSLIKHSPLGQAQCAQENLYESELSKDQYHALEFIEHSLKTVIVLDGITGSGKTQVFLAYARKILASNKQVLILMPEIALTNQIFQKIKEILQIEPLVYNSSISIKDKKSVWKSVYEFESCVVIGARSALFLPFKNLGLIIVDEEHDSSYKQDETTIYNARDMAIVKAHIENCKIILSSATISLETAVNVDNKKYDYVHLSARFFDVKMPQISLINTVHNKKNLGVISPQLHMAMNDALAKNQQIMLFLNKRGYAPVALCTQCFHKKTCIHCSANLVYHKSKNVLLCHYCGYMLDVDLYAKCDLCKSENFIFYGIGIEQVYEEVKQKFPNANVMIASSDTFKSKKHIEESIEKIQKNEVNIIIATQILSKGHHFKNLTLVGILDPDSGLLDSDIRAIEKTFQTLIQVSGRCGREINGKVLIQTMNPEHYIFKYLIEYNISGFLAVEKKYRLEAQYPPYTRFVGVIFSGSDFDDVVDCAKNFAYIKNDINGYFNFWKKERDSGQCIEDQFVKAEQQLNSNEKNINKCNIYEENINKNNQNITNEINANKQQHDIIKSNKVVNDGLCFVQNVHMKDFIEVLGPTVSPVAVIDKQLRWRILIKHRKDCDIQYFLRCFLKNFKKKSSVSIQIDIDPINFL